MAVLAGRDARWARPVRGCRLPPRAEGRSHVDCFSSPPSNGTVSCSNCSHCWPDVRVVCSCRPESPASRASPRYLELLQSVFLIKTIPAWSSNQTQRAVGTPKLAFVDTGVACRLYHYRTRDQVEVDGVIETPDGRVIAVEVKASATVRTEDLAGLRHLANLMGDRFVGGYVLYTGQQTLSFGDRIKAVPLDALWRLA